MKTVKYKDTTAAESSDLYKAIEVKKDMKLAETIYKETRAREKALMDSINARFPDSPK